MRSFSVVHLFVQLGRAPGDLPALSDSTMALRVHCLDALMLDRELEHMLHSYWERACTGLSAGTAAKFQPELRALFRSLLWFYSRGARQTPGQALQNVCYADAHALERSLDQEGFVLERRAAVASGASASGASASGTSAAPPSAAVPWAIKAGELAISVLIPWLWSRASAGVTAPERPERLRWWRLMRTAEALVNLLSTVLMLRFLSDGANPSLRAPSLPCLLLGRRLVYERSGLRRMPDFEFMNQVTSPFTPPPPTNPSN